MSADEKSDQPNANALAGDHKEKDSKTKPANDYGGIDINKLEFGGPLGASALMIWSHYILLYFWYCYETANGHFVLPLSKADLFFHLDRFGTTFMDKCIPSPYTWLCYFGFFVVQLVLAAYMPGLTMHGLPTAPHGTRLPYHCNGYAAYYFCVLGTFFAHYMGWFDLTYIATHFGEFLVASIIIGDVTSVLWYLYGILVPTVYPTRRTGNIIYDIFMGTCLYPRISFFPNSYVIDIKMVAECRWSWTTLMLLTSSCALTQYRQLGGRLTKEMMVMWYAHWLYSNATAKGEHCIPCTWDMFHENFGWMLNFWNIAGVPFLYCFQSIYVLKNGRLLERQLSTRFIVFVFVLLNVGYYVFDSANAQKASDKLKGVKRNTFPQVPWGRLTAPVRYIETPKGNLLVDGWYAHVRKLQYTGDIIMALCWGLCCGFESPLPYFYCCFFTGMICHRQIRDEERCHEKYGEYWEIYVREVPNVFIPGKSFFLWLIRDHCAPLPAVELPLHLVERNRLAREAKAGKAAAESTTAAATASSASSSDASAAEVKAEQRTASPSVTRTASSSSSSTSARRAQSPGPLVKTLSTQSQASTTSSSGAGETTPKRGRGRPPKWTTDTTPGSAATANATAAAPAPSSRVVASPTAAVSSASTSAPSANSSVIAKSDTPVKRTRSRKEN